MKKKGGREVERTVIEGGKKKKTPPKSTTFLGTGGEKKSGIQFVEFQNLGKN